MHIDDRAQMDPGEKPSKLRQSRWLKIERDTVNGYIRIIVDCSPNLYACAASLFERFLFLGEEGPNPKNLQNITHISQSYNPDMLS